MIGLSANHYIHVLQACVRNTAGRTHQYSRPSPPNHFSPRIHFSLNSEINLISLSIPAASAPAPLIKLGGKKQRITAVSLLCTLYTLSCRPCTVHCALYTIHCTLFTVQCPIHTVHCNCTLYIDHH